MKVLQITNIEKWNKGKLDRYIYYKPNKNKPTQEEIMYFNYRIFHYFTQHLHMIKEGIEIMFEPNDIPRDIFNNLTKNIKEYE